MPSNLCSVADPNADSVLTFKQYLETQDPNIDAEEATKKYLNYKTEFTTKQLAKFFAAHKTEEWFVEKYQPAAKAKREHEKIADSKAALAQFTVDLEQGKYASLNFDDPEVKAITASEAAAAKPADQEREGSPLRDEEMLEEGETQGVLGDKATRVLFIKTVPPNLKRAQIVELCQTVPGFIRLELSEPNAAKKCHRVGWVTFSESTDITKAHEQLNDSKVESFEFHFGILRQPTTKNLKIPPVSSTEERARKDLFLIKKLVALLDKEKGLENPLTMPENLESVTEVKKNLDLLIVYLRKVHFFDYYSALEFESEDSLARKCGGFPIRTRSTEAVPDMSWERNLDSKIETRLRVTLDEETSKKLGKKDVAAEIEKFVQSNVVKVDDGKFKCGFCPKLFKGTDFVTKHIHTKHEDSVQEIEDEATFFNNYVTDPNHILPPAPPTLAPPVPAAPLFGSPPGGFARTIPTLNPASLPMRPPLPAPFPLPPPFRPFQPPELPSLGGGGGFSNQPAMRPRTPFAPRPRPVVSRSEVAENDPRSLRNYGDLDDLPESSAILDYRTEGLAL